MNSNESVAVPSIYISTPNVTDFDKVFSSQLKSSLLSKGFDVKTTPKGALPIYFEVNAVQHHLVKKNMDYAPGTLTALAAGVMVIRDTVIYGAGTNSVIPTTIGLAATADLFALWIEFNKRPNTEISLTITAEVGDKYIIHRTDSYYVDTVDTGLFTTSKSKVFDVVTGEKK